MQMDAITTALVTPTAHHYRSGQMNKRNGVSVSYCIYASLGQTFN